MSLPAAVFRPVRICITGAECTGKSTLAMDLGARLGAPVVQEGGRDYFRRKAQSGDPIVYASDIARVIQMQVKAEDEAPRSAGILILDTDVFTISIWAERTLGRRIPEIDELLLLRDESDQHIDLYLLASPDIPFEHDSVRGSDELRSRMHEVFRESLARSGRRFVQVRGSRQQRCDQAATAVRRFLADEAPRPPHHLAAI